MGQIAAADVSAVTHGGFRRLLAARLVSAGWRRSPGPLGYLNWSS
jgi:hypothetical protein